MTALSASGDGRRPQGQAYKDKSKPTDIRSSNINAAKGISNINFIIKFYMMHSYWIISWNIRSENNKFYRSVQREDKSYHLWA